MTLALILYLKTADITEEHALGTRMGLPSVCNHSEPLSLVNMQRLFVQAPHALLWNRINR